MTRTFYDRVGETVYSEVLPNGLNVFIVPKRDYKKSFAIFSTDYGSNDTKYIVGGVSRTSPDGVAHFLEHKMFDMPDGNALQTLSSIGARPNAYTSNDITSYHFETTENFEECLRILLRFVSTPYFTQESVDKEQGIIGQEIRMIEDNPNWCVYTNLFKALYAYNPVRVSVAGTIDSISEITAQTLIDCYNTFYTPSNMALCVVGDVDPDMVVRAANEILPSEPGQGFVRDYGPAEPEGPAEKLVKARMEVSRPIFMAGFKCVPQESGRASLLAEYLAELAASVLAGRSSPLYNRLYSQGLIDNSFDCSFNSVRGSAAFTFGGESEDPEKVVDAVCSEAERIAEEGIDIELFERQKKSAFGSIIRLFDSFESTASAIVSTHFRQADFFETPDIFDEINADSVRSFIAGELRRDRLALSIVEPKGERN
ncbi:MAG: EF-P 5-aminopentanol modification-associated protein YfmH [Oscillospiraceae bacterium]|jgi:predicted Zn-dependent peptidase